jgi:hypothetical protein
MKLGSLYTRAPVAPALLACIVSGPVALAQTAPACNMKLAFEQPDDDGPGRRTAVWSDASGSALLFVEALQINTDGTRRSYKVEDFWGEKDALNNLCNAMEDKCAGLSSDQMRQRRILTQEAAAKGWPKEMLAATRIAPNIIAFKNGKPCPPVDGFLISATALQKPDVADVCDLSRYVDAAVVPALVLPGEPRFGKSEFATRNARKGDLVVAARPQMLEPVFGVVGDIGPPNNLGEASVAMNGKLLKKSAEPVNYEELRGKKGFAGKGWSVRQAAVLVFPGTRNAKEPFMSVDRLDPAAGERFTQWGGTPRLIACLRAMGHGKSIKEGS